MINYNQTLINILENKTVSVATKIDEHILLRKLLHALTEEEKRIIILRLEAETKNGMFYPEGKE